MAVSDIRLKNKQYNAYGMIFHSDRGSQYTSYAFREKLAEYGAVQSMSGTGRCYDNARMESFFATVKKEKLYKIKTELLPMSTVKSIIFRWQVKVCGRLMQPTVQQIHTFYALHMADTLRRLLYRPAFDCNK